MKLTYLDINQKDVEIKESGKYAYLFVGRQGDVVDSIINFIHKSPDITSNIHIKAVLFENSRFDLNAKLRIERGAKNTDSYLKIDVLLISESANAEVIPGLEVLEDSVKGGHGASIGPVDVEQITYLMSRGIKRHDAERAIAEGFINEIAELFPAGQIPSELVAELRKFDQKQES